MFDLKITKETTEEEFQKMLNDIVEETARKNHVSVDTVIFVAYFSDWYNDALIKWNKVKWEREHERKQSICG